MGGAGKLGEGHKVILAHSPLGKAAIGLPTIPAHRPAAIALDGLLQGGVGRVEWGEGGRRHPLLFICPWFSKAHERHGDPHQSAHGQC